MDVYFETRDGRSFCIEIGYFDSVLEIKEKVQKYQGIPVSRQTLIFKGNRLEDHRDVASCEFVHNSRIQLVIVPESSGKSTEKLLANLSTKIRLTLRFPVGKRQVEMGMEDTIFQLKGKIINEFFILENVTNSMLSIYLHGNELNENQSLRYYGVSTSNSELDVVIKQPQTTPMVVPSTSAGATNG